MDLKHRSRALTEGRDRAAARAYLKGIGYDDEALSQPIIGVANTWIETMPCNFHLRALAKHVKDGIKAAGGTPMELNTIAISDGITMGTSGMKTSLVSREVIADSIELVARGHLFDAVVALSGCDKTIPATVMALARVNDPSVMLYGGSIMPGRFKGADVTIQDVFEAVGKHAAGKMRDEARNGHALGLFVEGTRQRHGRPGTAQPGAAMIALQENVPVVPVAVYGTQFWRIGNFKPCSIAFGDPLELEGLPKGGRGYREATTEIERRINVLFDWLAEMHVRGRPDGTPPV